MKIKIQSIRDFFKSKEKKGLKPIFFESIGDQNTSRDERLKNLIKVLEKNGFKIKNSPNNTIVILTSLFNLKKNYFQGYAISYTLL